VKNRRGSATVSEESCFEVPLGKRLGKVKRRADQTATSKPGDLPESNGRLLRRTGRCMTAILIRFFHLELSPLSSAITSARGDL